MDFFLYKQDAGDAGSVPSFSPGVRLNFFGHALITMGLCLGAIAIWNNVYVGSAQRARAWYGCSETAAAPARKSDVPAPSVVEEQARTRLLQSCDSFAFYYGLLSSSVVVSGVFGLVGALGSLYIGKEGLAGAKNIVINSSIASLGVFSLAQAIPAGFQAEVGLKAAAEDVVRLSVPLSIYGQSQPQELVAALNKPRPIPAFDVDKSVFSILSGAMSSSAGMVNQVQSGLSNPAAQDQRTVGQDGGPAQANEPSRDSSPQPGK
jgi:hypothetical protein